MDEMKIPITFKDIISAHSRIKPFIHKTPVTTSRTVNKFCGKNVYFKCENLQKSGSFKVRGALNAVLTAKEQKANINGVTAHSSGNHGIAVSLAARVANLPCTIVVPNDTPPVKVNAIREYGAQVVFCESSPQSRRDVCEKVSRETGYIAIPPYDHVDVIAGQGTIAVEFLQDVPELEAILVPISGGGMTSGIAIAATAISPHMKVFAVEPHGKNLEACLKAGARLWLEPPRFLPTRAEGIKTQQLGHMTFPIVHQLAQHRVFTVSDEEMINAMKFTFERMKLVIELSSAAGVAVVLRPRPPPQQTSSSQLEQQQEPLDSVTNVGVILCGGNVDTDHLPWNSSATPQ